MDGRSLVGPVPLEREPTTEALDPRQTSSSQTSQGWESSLDQGYQVFLSFFSSLSSECQFLSSSQSIVKPDSTFF